MKPHALLLAAALLMPLQAFAEDKDRDRALLADSAHMPKEVPTGAPVEAEGKITLSLRQAQALALEHYPRMLASLSETKAAKQQVKIARSDYLPQVTGDAIRAFAGRSTRIGAPGGLNNPTVIDRGSGGVGVSQLITDFGHTTDLIESSKLELQAQKASAELTRESVLLNATRAYYNLLRAQELLNVAQTTLKTRKTVFEQISQLRKAKLKSNLDFSVAQQVVGEGKLLMLRAQNAVDSAQATLSEALGYNEPKSFIVSNDGAIPKPPEDMNALVAQAMDKNPALAALKAKHEAALKFADAQKAANYPTVSALGYAGTTPISTDSQPIRSHSLAGGVNVSIPFYTGGRISARENEAMDRADIAGQELQAEKNRLLRDIRIAYGDVQTSYQNISVMQEVLKNASESLDLTQERYHIGSSSIVDLSQAELAHTQARIESANATYEYLLSLALLDFKLGSSLLHTDTSGG